LDGRETFDVAVIGAGVVGLSVAESLAGRGASVVIIDRADQWGAGCSRANAGLICPSHSYPYASRQDLIQAARWLFREGTPFAVRPHAGLVPWLVRFLASTSEKQVERSAELLIDLAHESLALYQALDGSGAAIGFRQTGLLDVFETKRAFERGVKHTSRAARTGLIAEVLGAADVAREEPSIATPMAGGVLYPNEAYCDPVKVVNMLGTAAVRRGARSILGVVARRIENCGQSVCVWADDQAIWSKTVVIAAGVGSAGLARTVGVRLPLQPGKGYSVDLAPDGLGLCLRRPMMLQERRVAVTPFGNRVRLAGMMHVGHWDTRIEPSAVRSLQRTATSTLVDAQRARMIGSWCGLRPCTPDAIPLVGWVRHGRVALATGHGMLGVTLAPITGRIVADLLDGTASRFTRPVSPDRFR
jgi:D-amino-acid dehydrogenase